MKSGPVVYRCPLVILCEGSGDQQFFNKLIDQRKLPQYQAVFPGKEGDNTGGVSKYPAHLSGMISSSFFPQIKKLLVVADCDDDPPATFAVVQKSLDVNGYPIPKEQLERTPSSGFPEVAIMMIPFDKNGSRPGSLETLCLEAATWQPNLRKPLEDFVSQTPSANWSAAKSAKARAHCLLAVTCEKKPDVTFGNHWREREEYVVPLDDKRFDCVAEFLRTFAA